MEELAPLVKEIDMHKLLTLATIAIFALIAAVHLYWAMGGRLGMGAAIPSVGGAPVLSPSAGMTVLVALALFAAAALVATTGGALPLPLPRRLTDILAILLGLVMVARAIGDFRLLGFFKTRGDGPFATLDSWIYSPLCLLLGTAIFAILWFRPSPGDLP